MSVTWIIIRGSGMAAFVLLTASVLWGLLISGKVLGRAVKAKGLQWIHESLGLAAVLATVVHMIALVADSFVEFSWLDVLVPGMSTWQPLATALGVVAFWTGAVVAGSFYVKKWIGQRTWRSIHFASYGAFTAALVHGAMAGTDRANPVVVGVFAAAAIGVAGLTLIRVLTELGGAGRSEPRDTAARGDGATQVAGNPRTAAARAARAAAARAAKERELPEPADA